MTGDALTLAEHWQLGNRSYVVEVLRAHPNPVLMTAMMVSSMRSHDREQFVDYLFLDGVGRVA